MPSPHAWPAATSHKQSASPPKKLLLLQTRLPRAAIVWNRFAVATQGEWIEGNYPGDKLMNKINLFTPFVHAEDLCTFPRMVEALYKHCIQNPKALIKKNKRHLPTSTGHALSTTTTFIYSFF
jgi:hypothetical protein